MTLNKKMVNTGRINSPLDLLSDAITADADWTLKKSETHATDGYISLIWIEAINTTNGDRMALQLTFERGVGLYAKASEYIDLGQPAESQPNVAHSGMFIELDFVKEYGGWRGLQQDVVVVDRDYIYLGWVGEDDEIGDYMEVPKTAGCFLSTINKTNAYTQGILFVTNMAGGVSEREVFYEGNWYGDNILTYPDNRQCRINALYPEELYTQHLGKTDAYFYTAATIHINLSQTENNKELILLGYIPGNVYVTGDAFKTNRGMSIKLKDGTYAGYSALSIEGANVILFPTS